MNELNLNGSEKIMVFFGGLFKEEKKETPISRREFIEKAKETPFDDKPLYKEEEDLGRKIVETLNKQSYATNIQTLYSKTPSYILYNPIIFNIRIPLTLQKTDYNYLHEDVAEVDDFTIMENTGIQ